MNELNSQDGILIDKFLLDRLTHSELTAFEERKSDPLFEKELTFRRELLKISEQKGDEKLHTLLKEESKRLDAKMPKKKTKIYWIGLVLAALAGLFYFLTIHDAPPSNEELFVAHYEVFPNLLAPTERSNEADLMGAELALHAYDRGDFEKASAVFDTLSEINNDLMMYQAIVEFESGSIDRAKELLLKISNDNQAQYHEASEWYLCLFYLKNGDVENCKVQLKSISSFKEHRYYSKALELNQELE